MLTCNEFDLIPISIESAEYFAELYLSWIRDPETTTHLYQGTFPPTKEDASGIYTSFINKNNFVYYIWPKGVENPVGIEGIHDIYWPSRNGECRTLIGDKNYWNRGYAKKCLALMTEFAFENLNFYKFWYGYNQDHPKIKHAYRNNGFTEECVIQQHFYKNGKYSNLVRMRMFRNEYDEWRKSGNFEKILNKNE